MSFYLTGRLIVLSKTATLSAAPLVIFVLVHPIKAYENAYAFYLDQLFIDYKLIPCRDIRIRSMKRYQMYVRLEILTTLCREVRIRI